MKPSTVMVAVAATALILAAAAQAEPHQRHGHRSKTWAGLNLQERRVVVTREIQKHRSSIRWFLTHRSRYPAGASSSSARFVYCRAIGIHAPGEVCVHGQQLVSELHVRARIDAALAAAESRRRERAVAGIADFEVAAHYADRIWPGSYSWLMSCSSGEGGHGQWVWNGGAPYSSPNHGSGAGGWMQFMATTFDDNVGGAFAEAASRGYVLPASARSWLSPVGQTVTASYVRQHYGTGQWSGGGC